MTSGSVNAFNNEAGGTFTQEGTGTTEFTSDPSGMPFNNAGTVNVSAGTLQLTSGGSNSAAINVSAGAVANFSNSYTHAAGSSLNGAWDSPVLGRHADYCRRGDHGRHPRLHFRHDRRPWQPDGNGDGELDGRDDRIDRHDRCRLQRDTEHWGHRQSFVYLQGVLENDGTANWLGSYYSYIEMSNGTINNYGSWTANSPDTLGAYGMNSGSVNAFNNEASGTFTQEGTGTMEFTSDPSGMPFNNAGTVNVSAGTLQLTSGGSNSAAINVSAGAVANFSNSYTHAAGSSLNGAGTVQFSGGTQTIAGAVTMAGILDFTSGTIGGPGNLTATGTVNWTAGTIASTGLTDVASSGTLNIGGTESFVYLQGVLENDGTVNWLGSYYSYIEMSNGTINNYGSWTADSPDTLGAYGMNSGSVNAFNNEATGTFTQEGTGTTEFTSDPGGTPFNNAGTVNVSQGTLQLNSGGSNSAAINVSAGAVADFSANYTHATGSSLNGLGMIDFGATQTIAGTVTMSGILNLSSGTITGPGDLTATGTVNWTGGTIAVTGTTDIAAGGTLNIACPAYRTFTCRGCWKTTARPTGRPAATTVGSACPTARSTTTGRGRPTAVRGSTPTATPAVRPTPSTTTPAARSRRKGRARRSSPATPPAWPSTTPARSTC